MLFVNGEFVSHSGLLLPFKIDCDALTDSDLETLAIHAVPRLVRFQDVYGIPRGGTRLADVLKPSGSGLSSDPMLIVDDVLTTGASMEDARAMLGLNTIGLVIFSRTRVPEWITALFVETGRL
jgi:hypothetical protein